MSEATSVVKPAAWEEFLQTLHRHFYETAADQCLLWVNPAQGDVFAEDTLVDELRVRVPISHPNFDVGLAPYLVPLTLSKSRDADVFKVSVQTAWEAWTVSSLSAFNGQPVGGWVQSSVSPQAVARHWATHCHLHTVKNLNRLLRFHDPGVREWLWDAFSLSQRSLLLGNAEGIFAIGRHQDLIHHRREVKTQANGQAFTRLTLTDEQWEQVDDYATVHKAWLECCGAYPEFRSLQAKKPHWQHEVFDSLTQASMYGINDAQDRVLFAAHALTLGANFHMHPKLQALWKLTLSGNFYGGALEDISGHPAEQIQDYLSSD